MLIFLAIGMREAAANAGIAAALFFIETLSYRDHEVHTQLSCNPFGTLEFIGVQQHAKWLRGVQFHSGCSHSK